MIAAVAVLGILAVAMVGFLLVNGMSGDEPAKGEPASTVSVSSPSSEITIESSVPSTSIDQDASCRESFTAASVAGTDEAKFATLAACTEDQWIRAQTSVPIAGATLATLCDTRGERPATSCATADAERANRAAPLATSLPTTMAPIAPTTPATTMTLPPDPDRSMCAAVGQLIDDWWRNISTAGEIATALNSIRDQYRGSLSPRFQLAIDAAKSVVGAGNSGRMVNEASDFNGLGMLCNEAFGLGILGAPAI